MFIGSRNPNHVHAEFGGLPESVIQIIQSFLTSKEAAQTTLLSKSWRTAWLTRPNLDFDLADFCRDYVHELDPIFLEFGEKTLERYENLNLKIESFRLNTIIPGRWRSGPDIDQLIHRALKLGPTHLTFELQSFASHIPDEVFRCENLVSLTLKACDVNQNSNLEVYCSRLQFLSFEYVRMQSRDMLFHIISSCPLIEKLSLCCVGQYVSGESAVGLQTIYLHRLTSLVLKYVDFDTVFLADLSSKFPSLKDLTLYVNKGREEILISSPTLERLDFSMGSHNRECSGKVHKLRLDVPSIRKLTFECSSVPELSLKSNSRGWESYVHLYITWRNRGSLRASWFYSLSSFIKKLRLSRISLSLHVYSKDTFDYEGGDIQGFPTPEIENLNVYHEQLPSISCYALFDGLFRMCHPKVITQHLSSYGDLHFLVKRLLDAGLNDLNEARAQVFDKAVSTWRDVTLESLLQDSTIVAEVSFQLNWKM